jgi:hypothetical protein
MHQTLANPSLDYSVIPELCYFTGAVPSYLLQDFVGMLTLLRSPPSSIGWRLAEMDWIAWDQVPSEDRMVKVY